MMKIMLLGVLLLLAGCQTQPVVPQTVVVPVGPKAEASNAAQLKEIADQKALIASKDTAAQTAAGEVYGATIANTHNVDGPPKDTVAAFASAAAASLPPVTDTQKTLKDAQTLRALTGQLESVKLELNSAKAQAEIDAKARKDSEDQIAKSEAALVKLKAEAVAETEKNRKDVQTRFDEQKKAFDAEQKKLNDANQSIKDHETNIVVKACIGIGAFFLAASLGAAVFFVWSGSFSAKNIGACVAGFVASGLAFSLSRFLSHPWLPYVVAGAIVLICIVMAILFAKDHYDLHTAKTEAVADSNKMVSSVGNFMNEMRKAPDLADETKGKIVGLIDGVMDTKHQDAVRISAAQAPISSVSATSGT